MVCHRPKRRRLIQSGPHAGDPGTITAGGGRYAHRTNPEGLGNCPPTSGEDLVLHWDWFPGFWNTKTSQPGAVYENTQCFHLNSARTGRVRYEGHAIGNRFHDPHRTREPAVRLSPAWRTSQYAQNASSSRSPTLLSRL